MATIGSMKRAYTDQFGHATASADRAICIWLLLVAALVFAMVVVGGATRLTGSGLSITEWQPLLGTLPPLSDAAWQDAFRKYQQIPQYTILNKGMSLDAFKGIYWWEWSHRLLGRFLGAAFAIPFLFFLIRGHVRRGLAWKLGGLFVLGGLQGALGWFMVKSGLSERTEVSQYRLSAHLLLASALLAALLWTAFDVGADAQRRRIRLRTLPAGNKLLGMTILALIFVQIGAGALVAGLKAGLAYNTWPLMDGHVLPSGLAAMHPWWANLFENAATVQFDHRIAAYLLAGLVGWQTVRVFPVADDERVRRSVVALAASVSWQIVLGIWTLVSQVPFYLALSHQATAMLVLTAAVWHVHTLTRH